MRLWPLCLCAGIAAGTLHAGPFDGVFTQGEKWDCGLAGVDGGALVIRDDIFYGVEMQCLMQNPVNVRDMDAVLYDMSCSGEGNQWTERAMFMTAADKGLILVWNGYAFQYRRCPPPPE